MMLKRLYHCLIFLLVCHTGFGQRYYDFCDPINNKAHEVNLYFETGRYNLTSNHISALDSLKSLFIQEKKAGIYRFEVLGYTDTVGEDSANLLLSQKRVSSVREYYDQNPIVRQLCVGFRHMYYFFILSDSITDTTYVSRGYRGERIVNNDASIRNRRVNIRITLMQPDGPKCRFTPICCGTPKNDTTINTGGMELTLPQSSLSFRCDWPYPYPAACDSAARFEFTMKTWHYQDFVINHAQVNYGVCRLIQMEFTPNPFSYYARLKHVRNILSINSAYIPVKILLPPCEYENNVRLYGYHKNAEGQDTLHPLTDTRGELPQNIITENKQYYLVARVPIFETDSLVLAYTVKEKTAKTRTLVFKGNRKLKPYIINGCGLQEINTSTSGFILRKSEISISSEAKTVYIKSGEAGKYWPVKISQFKKRDGKLVLGRRKLKRITRQKPITICNE